MTAAGTSHRQQSALKNKTRHAYTKHDSLPASIFFIKKQRRYKQTLFMQSDISQPCFSFHSQPLSHLLRVVTLYDHLHVWVWTALSWCWTSLPLKSNTDQSVVVVGRFYIVLFFALEQTHCARICMSE